MNPLIGVLLGGGISLLATVVADVLRARHSRRHMLDVERLARMSEFVAAGNEVIGDLHDRGVRLAVSGPDSQAFLSTKERARESVDRLRRAKSNALMLSFARATEINHFMSGVDELRGLADDGFEKSDPRWETLKSDLSERLDALVSHVVSDLGGR